MTGKTIAAEVLYIWRLVAWNGTDKVRIHPTLIMLLNRGSNLEIREKRGFSPANLSMVNQDVVSLAELMDFGSNVFYPPELGPSDNAYCILAWPFEKGWNLISTVLLKRHDVNIMDKHPRTNESVLHLLAKLGDQRLIVAFEETVDLIQLDGQAIDNSDLTPLDYFNARNEKSTDVADAFHGLLRRIEDAKRINLPPNETLHQEAVSMVVSERTTTWDSTRGVTPVAEKHTTGRNRPTNAKIDGDYDIYAETHNRLPDFQYRLSPLVQPRSKDQDFAEELTLLKWQSQPRRRLMEGKYRGYDSGYTSAESTCSTGDEEDFVQPLGLNTDPRVTPKGWKRDARPSASQINQQLAQQFNYTRNASLSTAWSLRISCLSARRYISYIVARVRSNFQVSFFPSSWISDSFKRLCLRNLRPRIPVNHQRITWICVSGQRIPD